MTVKTWHKMSTKQGIMLQEEMIGNCVGNTTCEKWYEHAPEIGEYFVGCYNSIQQREYSKETRYCCIK